MDIPQCMVARVVGALQLLALFCLHPINVYQVTAQGQLLYHGPARMSNT